MIPYILILAMIGTATTRSTGGLTSQEFGSKEACMNVLHTVIKDEWVYFKGYCVPKHVKSVSEVR